MVILYIVLIYLIAGVGFALLFLSVLIKVVDEAVLNSPWTFRILLFPGCVVFWPLLLRKYLKARNNTHHD